MPCSFAQNLASGDSVIFVGLWMVYGFSSAIIEWHPPASASTFFPFLPDISLRPRLLVQFPFRLVSMGRENSADGRLRSSAHHDAAGQKPAAHYAVALAQNEA
jgi:hypothetical protein